MGSKLDSVYYVIQYATGKDAVWIHCSDGSTIGRFGKFGVDLHNTVSEQLLGKSQCRLCTHGRTTVADWDLFREKVKAWWDLDVLEDAFDIKFLKKS
jgi:hypothetical protein